MFTGDAPDATTGIGHGGFDVLTLPLAGRVAVVADNGRIALPLAGRVAGEDVLLLCVGAGICGGGGADPGPDSTGGGNASEGCVDGGAGVARSSGSPVVSSRFRFWFGRVVLSFSPRDVALSSI